MNDPNQRHSNTVNNGFFDLPADERAAAYKSACERFGEANFFDLSPEERGWAYDRATGDHEP